MSYISNPVQVLSVYVTFSFFIYFLVVYLDGSYGTLHPGEWEAWSPCSTPCGPDGRQSRNRSCLIYPSIFNYSSDGYELTESQECNIDVFPCVHGKY